jgi:hypothetical protein
VLRQRNSFIINDFDAVNFVTDVLVFFRGCGYLNRYRRARNRLWQFPRQELSLGVRVGCGVQQTERVQFGNYGRPEQSHNKPINIHGLKKEKENPYLAVYSHHSMLQYGLFARRDGNEMQKFLDVLSLLHCTL